MLGCLQMSRIATVIGHESSPPRTGDETPRCAFFRSLIPGELQLTWHRVFVCYRYPPSTQFAALASEMALAPRTVPLPIPTIGDSGFTHMPAIWPVSAPPSREICALPYENYIREKYWYNHIYLD